MNACKKIHPGDVRVGRSLSNASNLSLSPSELNDHIMEMINARQAATKCDAVCRGKSFLLLTCHHKEVK